MLIAYLFPADAPDPRDGLGFIVTAETKDEAVAKLRTQLTECYADETLTQKWNVDVPEHRDFVVVAGTPDGTDATETYWLHFADA